MARERAGPHRRRGGGGPALSRTAPFGADPEARRQELLREYLDEHANPVRAANKRFLDDVIEPGDTRIRVIQALELLRRKKDDPLPRKKHGNIPL